MCVYITAGLYNELRSSVCLFHLVFVPSVLSTKNATTSFRAMFPLSLLFFLKLDDLFGNKCVW